MRRWYLMVLFVFLPFYCFQARIVQAGSGDKTAYVDCNRGAFESTEPDQNRNEVAYGSMIKWVLRGTTGTKVKIEFVEKNISGATCLGESPFRRIHPEEATITNDGPPDFIIGGPVTRRPRVWTCYSYTIICTLPTKDTKPITIDPGIDVPP